MFKIGDIVQGPKDSIYYTVTKFGVPCVVVERPRLFGNTVEYPDLWVQVNDPTHQRFGEIYGVHSRYFTHYNPEKEKLEKRTRFINRIEKRHVKCTK